MEQVRTNPPAPIAPDQLDALLHVTTPRRWLALAGLGGLLLAALIWGFFATIPTTVEGQGVISPTDADVDGLQAVLYVTIADGQKIDVGMPVTLALSAVKKEAYGLLRGTVRAVDDFPSDGPHLLRVLGNSAYVETMLNNGALVEVRVDLVSAPGTASGYGWTSRDGPPIRLQRGMICTGAITIDERHPVQLLSP